MEPYEESIDTMLAVAKILGRLSIEGHITPDELARLQAELMKPKQELAFTSSPNYYAPAPASPNIVPLIDRLHPSTGTFFVTNDSIGVGNTFPIEQLLQQLK